MRKLLAAVAMMALVGCSDNVTDPITGSIAGVYRIQSVNGSSLPYVVPNSQDSEVVTDDVITMDDTGTWSEVYFYRTNGSSTVQSLNFNGQYYRSGANITLTENGQTQYSGTFDGRQLHFVAGNATLVYSR